MSKAAEVTVQITDNPNMKIYNTRFEMSSGPEVGSRGNFEDLGEFGRLFLAIIGVVQVHICPYALLITKAPLFMWTEIDPKIEDLLKTFVISQRQIKDAHATLVDTN